LVVEEVVELVDVVQWQIHQDFPAVEVEVQEK
jgi:hypothetical protein